MLLLIILRREFTVSASGSVDAVSEFPPFLFQPYRFCSAGFRRFCFSLTGLFQLVFAVSVICFTGLFESGSQNYRFYQIFRPCSSFTPLSLQKKVLTTSHHSLASRRCFSMRSSTSFRSSSGRFRFCRVFCISSTSSYPSK